MARQGIYGIRNMVNEKWYIGQSVDIDRRWRCELSRLRHCRLENPHLMAAWKKYGDGVFEFRILEECGEDMLDVREAAWIAHYRSDQREWGYNLESGGHTSKHLSEETRRKIGLANLGSKGPLGYKHDDEFRRRMSMAMMGNKNSLGYKHTEDSKRRIGRAKMGNHHTLGHKLSDETKEKMRRAKLGKRLSDSHRSNIAKARTGCSCPESTKRKIVKGVREYWRRKREDHV
jgi:group I intron endonuclease